jgi:hypothetical protein
LCIFILFPLYCILHVIINEKHYCKIYYITIYTHNDIPSQSTFPRRTWEKLSLRSICEPSLSYDTFTMLLRCHISPMRLLDLLLFSPPNIWSICYCDCQNAGDDIQQSHFSTCSSSQVVIFLPPCIARTALRLEFYLFCLTRHLPVLPGPRKGSIAHHQKRISGHSHTPYITVHRCAPGMSNIPKSLSSYTTQLNHAAHPPSTKAYHANTISDTSIQYCSIAPRYTGTTFQSQ